MTVTAPRRPQVNTLEGALREAASGTDYERAYYSGYALGWLNAFVDHDTLRDILTDAERSWTAVPFSFDQTRARYAMLPAGTNAMEVETLLHSGVLAGFKEATAERDDAVECTLCERRILTDDITDCAQCERHGWLHDGCRGSVCADGLYPQGCFER